MKPKLRVGTRTSPLAVAQTAGVVELLKRAGAAATLVPIGSDSPEIGDKSRWVKGLELALLEARIDIAVHSAKDVPGELPEGLKLASLLGRNRPESVCDLLYGVRDLEALEGPVRVGTASLRRQSQLLSAFPKITVVPLRGNVDSRLRKVADGLCDAAVLSRQGIERLYLAVAEDSTGQTQQLSQLGAQELYEALNGEQAHTLDLDRFVPAAGQGALALQTRIDDRRSLAAAESVGDRVTELCVRAERATVKRLGATCNSAVGVLATLDGATDNSQLQMSAFVGLPDGSQSIRDRLSGDSDQPEQLGQELGDRLLTVGAGELIAAGEMAL